MERKYKWYIEDNPSIPLEKIKEIVDENKGENSKIQAPSDRPKWPDKVHFTATPKTALAILDALEAYPFKTMTNAFYAWNVNLELRLVSGRWNNVEEHVPANAFRKEPLR